MNPEPLVLLQRYIRDLLAHPEALIKRGRENIETQDFSAAYIVVDDLAGAERESSGQKYDGDAEVMTYASRYRQPVTVDFYGTGARTRAQEFAVLIKSQLSLELQQALGLTVYADATLTDVKRLTGQQQGERVEVQFTIGYSVAIDVDTLRIDIAQIEVQSEQGQEVIQ